MRFEFKATEAGDKSISGTKRKNQSGFRGEGGGAAAGIADRRRDRRLFIRIKPSENDCGGAADRSIVCFVVPSDVIIGGIQDASSRLAADRLKARLVDWKLVTAEGRRAIDRSTASGPCARAIAIISLRNRRGEEKKRGLCSIPMSRRVQADRRLSRSERTRVRRHVRDRSNRSARSIIARA